MHYLQSQNGNMFTAAYFDMSGTDDPDSSEFEPLREYLPSEIPWCSEALGAHLPVILYLSARVRPWQDHDS